jgi:hypothetical protein
LLRHSTMALAHSEPFPPAPSDLAMSRFARRPAVCLATMGPSV